MSREWIIENGQGPAGNLDSYLSEKKETFSGMKYIAMYPDSFRSGIYGDGLKLEDLLEARIFNDEMELWITRNSIGEDFSWRIASEKDCRADAGAYYEQYQLIDMDTKLSGKPLDDGCIEIISTVGGKYALPIAAGQKRIKIITYVDYDENGMAYAADNRICCFIN